jgi:hypothetical protein
MNSSCSASVIFTIASAADSANFSEVPGSQAETRVCVTVDMQVAAQINTHKA